MHLPVELNANLIDYWPLNETGSTAYSYGSAGNNGTHINSPTNSKITNGKRCTTYNGTNQYTNLGNNVYSNSQFTNGAIALWARANSALAATDDRFIWWEGCVSVGRYDPTATNEWIMLMYDAVVPVAAIACGSIVVGEWKFLLLTWNGTNMYAYADGEYINSAAIGSPVFDSLSRDNTMGGNTYVPSYAPVSLSDVMMFDKLITAEEQLAIFRATYRR